MTYSLIQLAPGSYDLLLNKDIVASVVRTGHRSKEVHWIAELLENRPQPQRPFPFTPIEHTFATLEELCDWLGQPDVKSSRRNGSMSQI
jgi:hypothetical protein